MASAVSRSVSPATPRLAVAAVALAACFILVLFLASVFGPYGWFIDELYYLACAKRLAWGYVDHPPLSIAVLALVRGLADDAMWAIRLPPALAAGATALASALLARRLGGGAFAQSLAALGFKLLATAGTARTLASAGLVVEYVRKVTEDGATPSVVDLIRRGRCELVVNTPQGSGARTDGYRIREAALIARVPCVTTLSGAAAAVEAIAHARDEVALSLQERIDAEARTA